MKRKTNQLFVGFLAAIMVLSMLSIDLHAAENDYAQQSQVESSFEEIYKATGDYIASQGTPDVGSAGGEWMVIGLARSGRKVSEGYYNNVVQYVKEHINEKEQLHNTKSTDNSRVILALTALGLDVTNVDGHNLLQGLNDMTYIKKQGINGPIWALIAFDSYDYEISGGDATRDSLISYILDKKLPGGGWTLFGSNADPDMTAMALQALAPYYNEREDVKSAVDAALLRLSEMQTSTGGYGSWGTVNAESCAQVIVALTALGINPQTDVRFVKDGHSVLDALLTFYVDGGFCHVMGGKLNTMATEQGYYALVSYARLKDGKTSLYNMSDLKSSTGEGVTPPNEDTQKPNNNNQDNQATKPSDNNNKVQSPKTGDFSNITIYLCFMVLSLSGFALIGKKNRKER